MRFGKISSNGSVQVEFTNPMKFPSTSDFIELNQDLKLLDVRMLSGSETGDFSANLIFWKIDSVSPSLISIELEFERPI